MPVRENKNGVPVFLRSAEQKAELRQQKRLYECL